MSQALRKCIERGRAGIIAIAPNMHELDKAWQVLRLTREEQEYWDIIADPNSVPMKIELILNADLLQFEEKELARVWIKYHGGNNRNEHGVYRNPVRGKIIRRAAFT